MRLIDAEVMPHGEMWDNLTDIEKANVLCFLLKAPTVNALVLPCEVGDTVYRLLWSQGGKKRWNFHIAEQRVKNLHDIVDCIEGLNKTVFLTKEEAEAALEGREDKEDERQST